MIKTPFSPAADRNKDFILEVLKKYLTNTDSVVLEVGSGTAQHIHHFAPQFLSGQWWASDQGESFPVLQGALDRSKASNIYGPLEFEVGVHGWPLEAAFNCIYTANTFHIMRWEFVCQFIEMVGTHLPSEGFFFVYGPFNYKGQWTSESNRQFDEMLAQRQSGMGLRDFEKVEKRMAESGLSLRCDHEMPANNRLLVFQKNENGSQ